MKPRAPLKRTAMKRSGKLRSTKPIRSVNVEQARKRDARYKVKLAAYRASETYKVVAERAGGRCEYTVTGTVHGVAMRVRCDDRRELAHHHVSYRRFGGAELPSDILVVCDYHHALLESQHPTRRHGRLPRVA